MADKRISQLVERVDIANNDVLPIVASGATTTNKVTISSIQTFMQGNLDLGVTSVGITLGTTGTDVNVSGSPITTSGNITINFPTASASNRGLLSSADWTTFNSKQPSGNYVTLDTTQTITAQKTFTGSGSSDTMIISHGSGSGFALDVIKGGSGEAIRVTKTSGSGNAMTISGGNFEAPTIVKTGGTSTQYLMADGSTSTLTNPITGTGASGQVAFWNGTSSQTGDNGLFWDNTNKRLGINTTTPARTLDIFQASATVSVTPTANTQTVGFITNAIDNSVRGGFTTNIATGEVRIGALGGAGYFPTLYANGVEGFRMFATTRNVLIQNGGTFTDAGFRLDVNGTARVQGNLQLSNNAIIGGLGGETINIAKQSGAGSLSLIVNANTTIGGSLAVNNSSGITFSSAGGTGNGIYALQNTVFNFGKHSGGAGNPSFAFLTDDLYIFGATGNIGINTTTDAGFRLDVNGTARVQGATTINGNTAITATGTQIPLTLTAASTANNTMVLRHAGMYNAIQINNNAATPLEAGVIGWGNSSAISQLQNAFYFLVNTSNVPTASTRFTRFNGSSILVDGMFSSAGNFLLNTTTDNGTRLRVVGTTQSDTITQNLASHGVKVLQYSTTASTTINLPTEFPLMTGLVVANSYAVFGKFLGKYLSYGQAIEFYIAKNPNGMWNTVAYSDSSQFIASLVSVTGSGNDLTITTQTDTSFILELTVMTQS
jgi:hypothetical protein